MKLSLRKEGMYRIYFSSFLAQLRAGDLAFPSDVCAKPSNQFTSSLSAALPRTYLNNN